MSNVLRVRQPSKKFLLVHAVLEGLASVDEHNGDFVVELASQFVIAIHVYFLPCEPPAPREFGQAFFYHFAEVTTLARINHDLV